MTCPDALRTYFSLVPCRGDLWVSAWLLFPRSGYSCAVLSPPPNWFGSSVLMLGISCLTFGFKGITVGLGF